MGLYSSDTDRVGMLSNEAWLLAEELEETPCRRRFELSGVTRDRLLAQVP